MAATVTGANAWRRFTIPLAAVLCLAADQSSKSWARQELSEHSLQSLIPGFIHFTLTTNTGGAFGIGREAAWLMTGLAVTITAVIVLWILKRELSSQGPGALESLGMGMLLGGAAGNLVDRFLRGSVTDFLEFSFFSFPVFNVADICIDAGIVLIALGYYLDRYAPAAMHQSDEENVVKTKSETDLPHP